MAQGQSGDELRGLVYNSVGLVTDEQKALKQRERAGNITRITHHEIKAMRGSSARTTHASIEAVKTINTGVIRLIYLVSEFFKPRAKWNCTLAGHECLHCGQSVHQHRAQATQ